MASTPVTPSDAKGYDNSPPRNGTIFFYTVLAVFFLVCIDFLLVSYFDKVMEGEVHAKILTQGMEEVASLRAQEREKLGSVEAAMRTLAQRGRTGVPQLIPESGAGKAPIEGWSQLKREVPAAEPQEPAAEPAETVPAGPGIVPPGAGAAPEGATQAPTDETAPSTTTGAGAGHP